MTSAEQMAINTAANEALIKREFSNEIWISAENIKLNHTEMPKNADGIIVARSRLPKNLQEELDFIKEIKSAILLMKYGASVTLIPRIKRPDGKGFLPGPDAIVNGTFYEFKEVTGGIDKIGARFNDSRKQSNNVYIRIANPKITKQHTMKYMSKLINGRDYNGGYHGNVIFTFETGIEQQTYFFRISDFKK